MKDQLLDRGKAVLIYILQNTVIPFSESGYYFFIRQPFHLKRVAI